MLARRGSGAGKLRHIDQTKGTRLASRGTGQAARRHPGKDLTMKNLVSEFKEFINRGNVIDMAVGIIIGSAFTAIVTALTTNIVNPLIMLITGGNGTEVSGLVIPVPGSDTGIDFGAFISAVINFLIVAFIVFLMVKAFNKMKDGGKKHLMRGKNGEELEEVPPTCPFCLEEINVGATRCPHCTAELPAPAEVTYKPAE